MQDFFSNLFSTSGFPPRWYCGTWPESLGWLHIGSDIAIFGAYVGIPAVLLYFIYKRNDLPFLPVFWLFGLFILFCGFGHLVEASMFWQPWYHFSGLIKFCTAVVSWITVFAIFKIIPQALEIPNMAAVTKFKEVVHAMPFATVIFNEDGSVDFWNKAAKNLLGCDKKLTQKLSDLISPKDRTAFNEWLINILGSSLKNTEIFTKEFRALKSNKEEFCAEVKISLLFGGADKNGICKITDLTEIKSLEFQKQKYISKLEISNQELEEFSHIAAHDLKEPINSIQKHAQIIFEDHKSLDEDIEFRLNRIISLTETQRKLVNDLLYFSSIESKNNEVQICNLNKIIDEIRGSFVSELTGSLEILVPKEIPNVQCEVAKIREVFRNLITNSVKYNDKAIKCVEVGMYDEIDGKKEVFYIKDNGIGIDKMYHERVFEMFKRLHSTSEYGGGTGAGLAFVKKIIERHNGQIWLDSEVGKGTTMYFTLNQMNEV